jgi:hypothetical protein
MTGPPLEQLEQLKNENARLTQQRDQLLRERADLSQRLNAALNTLVTRDASSYSTAGAPRQHDQLVQAFRQLKIQDFQELTQSLFDHRRQGARPVKNRNNTVADIRSLLAHQILGLGSRLLAIRQTDLIGDLHAAKDEILVKLQKRLEEVWECQIPEPLLQELHEAVLKGLQLVRDIGAAAPPGTLFFPKKDAPFDPERHEPLHARPPGGAPRIALTIFPGYLIGMQDRVFEKALVYLDRQ